MLSYPGNDVPRWSADVRWRVSLSAAIVTHLVTQHRLRGPVLPGSRHVQGGLRVTARIVILVLPVVPGAGQAGAHPSQITRVLSSLLLSR